MAVLLGMGIFVMLITFLICVALYVLYSLPLYQMAERAGVEYAWLAWIPLAQIYILCMLSNNEITYFGQIHFEKRQQAFWAFVILLAVSVIINFIPFIGGILSLAAKILAVIVLWRFNYDFLKTYKGADADVMVVSIIGTLINIVMIVEFWVLRNEEPDYSYQG